MPNSNKNRQMKELHAKFTRGKDFDLKVYIVGLFFAPVFLRS